MLCKQHATSNPQFESGNRDRRIHGHLVVCCHVWEPDKEGVTYGLPHLEIL